jgi:branched-chain amino acid transport system ATP-binding protein
MSGGEQQMLAIARGLMAEPVLLILDEPSLGLSPLLVEEMFSLIRTLRDGGLAVLLVEQNVRSALSVADQGIVLSLGRVVTRNSAADLRDDADLRHAYLGF